MFQYGWPALQPLAVALWEGSDEHSPRGGVWPCSVWPSLFARLAWTPGPACSISSATMSVVSTAWARKDPSLPNGTEIECGVWVECSDTEGLLDAKPSQIAVGCSAVPLVDARPRADHRGR